MDYMGNDNNEFDDFKVAESSYASDIIGSVLEKEHSEIERFKEDFDDQLAMADDAKDELTNIVVGYIQGVGDVNQVNLCSYRAKNGIALDGWGFNADGDMTTIDLFLTLYVNPDESSKISATELDRHFNWLQRFYEQSLSGSIFAKIQNAHTDLNQVAQLINQTDCIDRIRLFLLTNAIMPGNYEKDTIELENGMVCEFYVWDAKRIMQQDNILSGRNPIVVDFEGDYNCTLPCVKMPDVSDSVSCYLCIIPGLVLSQVYHEYHQQILEMNVRTFLQFKGASNKGIRDTLIGHKATAQEIRKGMEDKEPEPDMFFAYNNGISATASEIRLNEDGNAISKIKSWQIVNGGQTTAAISAVMGMKNTDLSSLARVYVPMKVSVIKNQDELNNIVPKISRYANTQSAIKKSDYNINEGFLVELEQHSREEWVINQQGKPVSKWFFERTRGQFLDKAKRTQTAKGEKEFYAEYPKEQMFDKTFLSKFMVAWDQNPASVCKGGENNYSVFFEKAKREGIRFDATRFHRTIAKAILFKAIDAYYGKDGVALPGFKSNMVAYTLSLLSHLSAKALDLDAIWREQCVITQSIYNELTVSLYSIYAKLICGNEHISYKVKETYTDTSGERKNRYIPREVPEEDLERLRNTTLYKVLELVKEVHPLVYKHMISVNEGENINEWTKRILCWEALKAEINKSGTRYNVPQELCSAAGDMDVEVTEGQRKVIEEAVEISPDIWFSINKWSKDNPGLLAPREQAFMGQIGFNVKCGRPLTYKQAKWALSILEKAQELGWTE